MKDKLDKLDKILNELQDLNFKIGRLALFIANNDDDAEEDRFKVLRTQLEIMTEYRKILEERIMKIYY